jgi:hypothetical protein
MTSQSLVPVGVQPILLQWHETIGLLRGVYQLTNSPLSYRVLGERGVFYLVQHPAGTSEQDLERSDHFFQMMAASNHPVTSRYLFNHSNKIGAKWFDQIWTLCELPSRAEVNSAWQSESLSQTMIDFAAEALAQIHAHGLVCLREDQLDGMPFSPNPEIHLIERLVQVGRRIYNSNIPLAQLFCTLVPLYPADTTEQYVHLIDNTNQPDNMVKRDVEPHLSRADVRWMQGAWRGPACWSDLIERARETLHDLRTAEQTLGFPTTVLHGNYSFQNLVFDGPRLAQVLGWQSYRLGSPLQDLGHAAVMLCTRWGRQSRPYLIDTPADFDKYRFDRLRSRYLSALHELCGSVTMDSSFGRATKSMKLLIGYMRLACYCILVEELERIFTAVNDPRAKERIYLIPQVMHVERLSWTYLRWAY